MPIRRIIPKSASQELSAFVPGSVVTEGLRVTNIRSIPQDLRAGAKVVVSIAPPSGRIDAKPETLVAVAVKSFWDSPTVKKTRTVIVTALGGGLALICGAVLTQGSIFGLNWPKVLHLAADAVAVALAAAYSGWFLKRKDNNPVNDGPSSV